MYDVIIIGKGPAGISASIYTSRGKLNTLIIGGDSILAKSDHIDNYFGFPNGISGRDLLKLGEEQVRNFSVEIKNEKVLSIVVNEDMTFEVVTQENKYNARSILIATGQALNKVKINNIEKFEGKGIHYCVVCDGFFYNNKSVGILGYTDYAIHETKELQHFSQDVTLYTNEKSLEINTDNGMYLSNSKIKINNKKIIEFKGDERLRTIVFEDNSEEKIEGLFVAYGTASSTDFARKLGIQMNKEIILIDKNQMTNIPGVFAAGDCTSEFKQVSVSVGQGAIAGQKIVEYIRNLGK